MCTSALKCTKMKEIRLLDLLWAGISNSNQLQTSQNWAEFLDLRFNQINSLNLSRLLILFPNLRAIDARDDLHFDCRLARERRVAVFSDCELRSTNVRSTTASAQHITPNANDSPVSYQAPHLHITPNDRPVTYRAPRLHITPNDRPVSYQAPRLQDHSLECRQPVHCNQLQL